jgi:hypothetical protein
VNAKRIPAKPEPEATQVVEQSVPPPEPADPLAGYRSAIADLSAAGQQLADMREVLEHLRGEQARLEVDRERLLESASARDSEGDVDMLTRLAVRSEVLQRKVARIRAEIAEAEAKGKTEFAGVSTKITTLWRLFVAWLFDFEKSKISDLIVAAREHKRSGLITSLVSGPSYLRIRKSSGPD